MFRYTYLKLRKVRAKYAKKEKPVNIPAKLPQRSNVYLYRVAINQENLYVMDSVIHALFAFHTRD